MSTVGKVLLLKGMNDATTIITPVSIVWLQSLKEKTIVFIYIVLSFIYFGQSLMLIA